MKYKIFIGWADNYRQHNIEINKQIFAKVSYTLQNSDGTTTIINEAWGLLFSKKYQIYLIDNNSQFSACIKPFIELDEVPEDYIIGDKFKIQNLKPTWQYLGKNLAVSTEYYGPLKLDELENKIEELKNDR